jgi:hypothetical protein
MEQVGADGIIVQQALEAVYTPCCIHRNRSLHRIPPSTKLLALPLASANMSVSRDPSVVAPARPRTAASFLSRPPSTRPGTAFGARSNAHSDNPGEWVVAVNQGRGKYASR